MCSAYSRTCVVGRTYNNFGDRCFAAAGPSLWNSLPAGPRQTDISCEQSKWLLKSKDLFVWALRSRHCDYLFTLCLLKLLRIIIINLLLLLLSSLSSSSSSSMIFNYSAIPQVAARLRNGGLSPVHTVAEK